MKLANPTLIGQGRLALALALVPLALTGCPADSNTPAESEASSTTDNDDDDDESGDETESTTEDTTTGDTESAGTTTTTTSESATEPDDTTSTTEDPAESSSSTTGPPPGGLGCGITPTCDKGELVGSAQLMSADDIELIAGYTSMTGWLEITRTDLECLDFLVCLETVGHDVSIFGNEFLLDVSGTDNITDLGVSTADMGGADQDGTLVFSQNNAITDFNGFNSLESAQQSLTLSDNASMTTISGFGGLIGTFRDLTLRFNPVLETLDDEGLKDMRFIGGECVITNNPSLCITDIQEVCGDLEQGPLGGGNTANNKDC